MAYTKGKWSYSPEDYNSEEQSLDTHPGSIICDDNNGFTWYIASIEYLGDEEGDRANAHLIAAAPDLLEACKAIHEWLGTDDAAQALPFEPPWYQQLREAIAKAKGEAPNV